MSQNIKNDNIYIDKPADERKKKTKEVIRFTVEVSRKIFIIPDVKFNF